MQEEIATLVAALLVVAATSAGMRATPGIAGRVIGVQSGRLPALDGLRGILVLSVLLHHGFLTRAMAAPGDWPVEQSRFVEQLGSAAVAIFFMISAFLFGGRLLRDGGRLDVVRLALGRTMRIVPLYLLAIALFVGIAVIAEGGPQVPAGKLLRSTGRWLAFDFVPKYEVNGFPDGLRVMGQIWTLHWEWLFYFCLPAMGWAVRWLKGTWAAYALLAIVAITYSPLFWLFLAGLAVNQLAMLRHRWAGVAWQVGAVAGLLVLFRNYNLSRDWPQALLLVPTLTAAVRNDGVFAVLGRPVVRFLGEISYSFYLLHGVVLYVATEWVIGMDAFRGLDTFGFAFAMAGVGIATVILSTGTFLLVERPAMRVFHGRPVPQNLEMWIGWAMRRSWRVKRAGSAEPS